MLNKIIFTIGDAFFSILNAFCIFNNAEYNSKCPKFRSDIYD